MFIDRIDGNVEHNKLSALHVLNILPNDWGTIKIKTELFIKTNAASSTYRINTKKWNQVVSTLIGGTKKDVTIICNYAHSGSKTTFNFSRSDLLGTNFSRDDKYKNFRFESFDFFTLINNYNNKEKKKKKKKNDNDGNKGTPVCLSLPVKAKVSPDKKMPMILVRRIHVRISLS